MIYALQCLQSINKILLQCNVFIDKTYSKCTLHRFPKAFISKQTKIILKEWTASPQKNKFRLIKSVKASVNKTMRTVVSHLTKLTKSFN